MGLAQSALVPVANMVLQWTGFPLMFAYWWYNRRFLSSWMTVVFLFAYQLLVILGNNITNPLNYFVFGSQDYYDANLIFNCVLPALAIGYALMGSGWALFLDGAELFPIGALIPATFNSKPYTFTFRETDGSYVVDEKRTVAADPPRWGIRGLRATWGHFLVSILAFLAIVAVPQILYTWYIGLPSTNPGDELLAWMLNLWLPVPLYLLYGLWCFFVGDAYVFGPNERYLRQNREQFALVTSAQKKEIIADTNARVARTLVPLALAQFLTSLVLGGTRFITNDVDNNWLTAVGYWAFLLLVVVIMAIVLRGRRNKAEREELFEADDRQPCEDESRYDNATVNSRYSSVAHRSALGQAFADDS